jgi:ankyrin repeat protein
MDVNVSAWGPKSKGVTPLHLAAEGGHLGVMDELLERGANIDARTKGACGCKFLCFPCRLKYLQYICIQI